MKRALFFLAISFIVISCGKDNKRPTGDAPAEGFDLAHSDPAAVELADSIMIAMGGRENWDKTRFISWRGFGQRNWNWDKKLNRVRVESLNDNTIYLVNLEKNSGRVRVRGQEITDPDSLKRLLEFAKFWHGYELHGLAMPFKLKDSGITLKYLGEDTLRGSRYNIIQLIETAGDTSVAQLKLYIDVKEKLVRYWMSYNDTTKITDDGIPRTVKFDESLPDKIFTEFQ